MGLFRSKEEKAVIGLFKQRQAFTQQYVGTVQHLVAGFQQMGMSDELLDNQGMQDGLYILHDAIIVLSQTTLRGTKKEDAAADLLFFVEEARVSESNLTAGEHKDAVIAAYEAYMKALKKVQANNDGMTVPILSALKTIKPLADFYVEKGRLDVMMQLPLIEQDILVSYEQYWAKHL